MAVQVKPTDVTSTAGIFSVSTDQSRIMLVTRFGIFYQGQKPVDVYARQPDFTLGLSGGSELVYTPGTVSVIDRPGNGTKGNSPIEEIRRKGLLPASNQTDVSKGIYESDTGQLWMNARAKTMLVKTPRFEGICTASLTKETVLGATTIHQCSVPASVSVIAVDDAPDLASSRRVLVVFTTDARNSKMELKDSGKLLQNRGDLPVRLRTGTLSLSVANAFNSPVKAWALTMNGERTESLAVKAKNGGFALDIDTRILLHGSTPFFEIVKDNQ